MTNDIKYRKTDGFYKLNSLEKNLSKIKLDNSIK